ncbi:MAG: hypothetical protein JSS39_15075 [Nitrospira sp.]|nr:hypothetical protein [Nitrospira sp.]
MDMLMIVFRASLQVRVHEILRSCDVLAFTEIPETVGTGQSGPAEGISFYPETNRVIMVALEPAQRDKVGTAIKEWCDETLKRPGWVKPAIRVFSWPCTQLA